MAGEALATESDEEEIPPAVVVALVEAEGGRNVELDGGGIGGRTGWGDVGGVMVWWQVVGDGGGRGREGSKLLVKGDFIGI
jgi:hypothetical protein